MVLRSVPACIDSGNWLQDPVLGVPSEDPLPCPRPLMDRRLKLNAELALRCPRCDSSNTKFCYYNNYSLSQPRYFCKNCRRYWTKGGSLRNVPVGGGCRKNKRFKRTTDQSSQTDPSATSTPNNTTNDVTSCSENLNLPAVPSIYFTLLNGGVDGLGIAYSNGSVNHHQLRVAATDGLVVPTDNCSNNNNNSIFEIRGTVTATASEQPLGNMSNLNNAYRSLKASLCGPDQQSPFNGDLTTLFDAHRHHHHHQSISHLGNSSSSGDKRLFTSDVTPPRHHHDSTFDVQWQNLDSGQGLLPFDHEDNSAVTDLKSPDDIKLLIHGVHSSLAAAGGGGDEIVINRPPPISPYALQQHQQPSTQGILLDSSSYSHYWNAAPQWPDLSCFPPYTNALI